jgi:hypothetical protein
MPDNPYAPPSASVEDQPESPGKRPLWIWVVFIFVCFGIVSGFISTMMVLSGRVVPDAGTAAYVASLTWGDHILTLISYGLYLAAAITLFGLRAVAPKLFGAHLGLTLLVMAYHLVAKPGYAELFRGPGAVGLVSGLAINVAIVLYSLRLRQGGVLR